MKNHLSLLATGALICTACVPSAPTDTTAPTVTQVTAVATPARTYTPSYTFNTTEAGTIIYGGDCSSATTSATKGDNTISFSTLANGTYSNCTITVKDAANNSSSPLVVSSFTVYWVKYPINDTGQANCGDYGYTDTNAGSDTGGTYNVTGSGTHNNDLDCSAQAVVPTQTIDGTEVGATGGDIVRANQDALTGRDANGATNSDTDGHKGFSFTKIDSDGTALDASAVSWYCVKDNVTGLLWEVKTDDGGLQDKDHTYSWYNSSGSNDGGSAGTANGGVCSGGTGCDTEKYVTDINASNSGAGLCGANDWVLPSEEELSSIVSFDRSSPSIDTSYFPNAISNGYWSVSPYHYFDYAWSVSFGNGGDNADLKSAARYVRLVRRNI